jgi:hypothetical protein
MRAFFSTSLNTIEWQQELDIIPRQGDFISHYPYGKSGAKGPDYYRVVFVTHDYDDREAPDTQFQPIRPGDTVVVRDAAPRRRGEPKTDPQVYIRVKKTVGPYRQADRK